MDEGQPTARGLIRLFHAFEVELLERLARRGYGDVTPGHLNVLRHLDRGGLHVGELARDAGLTKQAVSKTVDALVRRGYLRTQAEARDGRARRVVYTRQGRRLVATAVTEVREIEANWRRTLGPAAHDALREALARLLRHYGA